MFNRFHLSASVAALAMLAGVSAAQAADTNEGGFTAGSILVRARALGVMPDTSTTTRSPAAGVVGGEADITDNWVPELDATYFITPNIGIEAIAGVTYHDVSLKSNALPGLTGLNSIGGTPLSPLPLGSVRLLPPTITAQWHFLPTEKFNPYVGAGINYTFFYNQHGGPSNIIQSTHYDDALGAALQFGFDYNITGNWYANVDVKKLFLSTNVHVGTILGQVTEKVDIDPWLVGIGIGYRF